MERFTAGLRALEDLIERGDVRFEGTTAGGDIGQCHEQATGQLEPYRKKLDDRGWAIRYLYRKNQMLISTKMVIERQSSVAI